MTYLVISNNKYYFGPFSSEEVAKRFASEECSNPTQVVECYPIHRDYDDAVKFDDEGSHYTFSYPPQ